jgi:folate-binding protein YgfZ
MDKVTLANLSGEYSQIDVEGPQADQQLLLAGVTALPEVGQIYTTQINGCAITLIGRLGLFGAGYRMVFPNTASAAIEEWLTSSGIEAMSETEFELLRIEHGLPGEKTELNENFTPLEVNLSEYVSGTKGCYTGQEVLARQVTYDKITRRLVGLKLSQTVEPGSPVVAEGKLIGNVTSSAKSPRFGPLALAVLKRPYFEPGLEVSIEASSGWVTGSIATLPFR